NFSIIFPYLIRFLTGTGNLSGKNYFPIYNNGTESIEIINVLFRNRGSVARKTESNFGITHITDFQRHPLGNVQGNAIAGITDFEGDLQVACLLLATIGGDSPLKKKARFLL